MPALAADPAYETSLGACYHADALDVLSSVPSGSVALVLTSPPFALHRKKAYGNVEPAAYLDWFWTFAEEIFRVLRPDGSFVFELGPTWNRGTGTRSLLHYELILRLCKSFHLAQEFYWYNPCKLPGPAEYVTKRRTHVKDAVTPIWWLTRTTKPNADNRRVLRPYSPSMKRLLRDGYQTGVRPSQHEISGHFGRDNGGAIPPNLLEVPNTISQDEYLHACRAAGLPIHPARFHAAVPEFFIRFLTEEGQRVVDPFAGSNVTGAVAERLGRRWLAVELNGDYVAGSRLRFANSTAAAA
jgi:DNA modification methylase